MAHNSVEKLVGVVSFNCLLAPMSRKMDSKYRIRDLLQTHQTYPRCLAADIAVVTECHPALH